MTGASGPEELRAALAFERRYAERGGMTVEQLRTRGRVVVPCNCGDAICEGWASMPCDVAPDYKAMGRIPQNWRWPPQATGRP